MRPYPGTVLLFVTAVSLQYTRPVLLTQELILVTRTDRLVAATVTFIQVQAVVVTVTFLTVFHASLILPAVEVVLRTDAPFW